MTLDEAIVAAVRAHAGQTDKAGQPYILHVIRVMLSMDNDTKRIVAVLHDTAEDCYDEFCATIKPHLDNEILLAILSVTRAKNETYSEFIARASLNEIGREVKIADLKDNLSRKLPDTPANNQRVERYERALAFLRH